MYTTRIEPSGVMQCGGLLHTHHHCKVPKVKYNDLDEVEINKKVGPSDYKRHYMVA